MLYAGRIKGRLTDAELAQLNRLLEQAMEIITGARRTPDDGESRMVALTFAMSPVPVGRSGRT